MRCIAYHPSDGHDRRSTHLATHSGDSYTKIQPEHLPDTLEEGRRRGGGVCWESILASYPVRRSETNSIFLHPDPFPHAAE